MHDKDEVQSDLPIVVVEGEPLKNLPHDLYIPPHALRVLLSSFTGPLDLLFYLIKKQNIDILNIPIALITEQYLHYIKLMEAERLELAAEYLLMAAMLAEIKARLLLPTVASDHLSIEEDPRMALVRRLQAYEQMQQQAVALEQAARLEVDFFQANTVVDAKILIQPAPVVLLSNLLEAMNGLLEVQQHCVSHQITREKLSIKDRINDILIKLESNQVMAFHQFFKGQEGPDGVVVSLLAILELARQTMIKITQAEAFAPIYIQAVAHG